jgi:hypothetical protein
VSCNTLRNTDFDERVGAGVEAIMWGETHEVYNDIIRNLWDVGHDKKQ